MTTATTLQVALLTLPVWVVLVAGWVQRRRERECRADKLYVREFMREERRRRRTGVAW